LDAFSKLFGRSDEDLLNEVVGENKVQTSPAPRQPTKQAEEDPVDAMKKLLREGVFIQKPQVHAEESLFSVKLFREQK